MSDFWTLDHLARALARRVSGAAPRGSAPITRIATDTRAIAAGDCFVALRGERFDAHDFLDDAVAAGAAALVVSRPPRTGAAGVPVYVVDDTLVALGDLGGYWRRVWGGTVVAIAGSNGKTSTKELLRAALEPVLPVHATRGNLNNRVGVPLTLLAIHPTASVAIVEVGTNLPGEVALLRDIARPDVAIVTSIAEEHLEGLGSLDGVLREEASVCDGAEFAVVPHAEEQLVREARARARRVITAGVDVGDFHFDSWSLTPDGKGRAIAGDVVVESPLAGAHNVANLALALATARALGVSIADAARGIAGLVPPPMRASVERCGAFRVVNDAYNSNPGSARAAVAMLSAMPASCRIAILGTMLELGSESERYHDDIARAAVAAPLDVVAGIGELGAALARIAPGDPRVIAAADVDDLWPILCRRLAAGATVLVKASRGVRLERIIPHLSAWTDRAC